jgi:hypothetical protein
MSAIPIPLSRYIRRKIKKLWNFPMAAKIFNLSVAKQESLRNQLIALDAAKRKLLLIKKEKSIVDYRVVDLQNVQQVSVKKVYGNIPAGDLQTKELNYYLQSVSLQLRFKSGAEPVDVNFYESRYHTIKQQSFLEAAANKWKQFVSDLLPTSPVMAQA